MERKHTKSKLLHLQRNIKFSHFTVYPFLSHLQKKFIIKPLIVKPPMGSSQHHVHNSKQFADEIKEIKLEERECITSYDVTVLFTSIPVPSALDIIRGKLEHDADLPTRTNMSADTILELSGFCLNNTYFGFQEVFYEQTKGAAHGVTLKSNCGQYIHGGI